MISVQNLTKRFADCTALKELSCSIPDGCVYGMVGSNGAGKSTFMRVLAGVYRADGGSATIDGEPIWENPKVKQRIAYVPDELYFLPGASINRMTDFYAALYPCFQRTRFSALTEQLQLDPKKPISTFSKGMQRQAAAILAICTKPDYIFFDETFDGLDPVMRRFVKNLLCEEVLERNATAVITSHSLRELEDTCDQLALLHKGGLVLESEVQSLKTTQYKIQIAFADDYDRSRFDGIELLHFTKHGSVSNLIVRGDRDETTTRLRALKPTVLDVLPLSLDEVFTYELELLGYKFNPEEETV